MILMLLNDASDAAAIKAEHDRLRAIDKEREKKHNQKFKGPSSTGFARLMPDNLYI